ncbi:hypothetical protein BE20_29195 [Sorangium cellulosum]|nr:hypothetical protein BE20_29195 [Sorangium cellulosum]
MTRKGVPVASSTPASKTSTMYSSAAMRASSLKRSRISSSAKMCGCMALRARRRAVSRCTTSWMLPIPPVAMRRTTR